MEFQTLLDQRNLSKYKLSQLSGVPKTTIFDICAGRSSLENCTAKTVYRLAQALECTVETLLTLAATYDEQGLPTDKSYFECGLPDYLYASIDAMEKTWAILDSGQRNTTYDLDFCELQADINRAENDEMISSEQAWYLREKYLRMKREEDFL